MKSIKLAAVVVTMMSLGDLDAQVFGIQTDQIHRPKIHFTPRQGWMNDPNGLVFHAGVYHLFYQHNPNASVWGPMHWGHATSKDMINWEHQPIALFPDSLGTIFSGSAVVDVDNTSRLAPEGQVPLVSIFTYHNQLMADKGRKDFQSQGIAYSIDKGKTWQKYSGNPVLKNPGIADFRDPKVMWHEASKKWIMTLAVRDRIHFYSSPNLKEWKKESEFGLDAGAHGGVWECPDLFPMQLDDKTIWTLLVNINPGGPNKGSATQYFLGSFDGHQFTPYSKETKWLDYGPDEYAGVTWSNTGSRRLFIGWMSNWMYANQVPTETWRSACTIPRELKLVKNGNSYRIASMPVAELANYQGKAIVHAGLKPGREDGVSSITLDMDSPAKMELEIPSDGDFRFNIFNENNEVLKVGFNKASSMFFIDRTQAGKNYFHKEFAAKHLAPRLSTQKNMRLTLVIDVASVELFADDGLTTMTSVFFPSILYNKISFASEVAATKLSFSPLKRMF